MRCCRSPPPRHRFWNIPSRYGNSRGGSCRRGTCFISGAAKLKEICYIHAEGYAAGEMKHGPIALIDQAVPVIAIVPSGPMFEKTASNLQEAAARGGQVIVLSDAAGAAKLKGISAETVILPDVD